MLALVSLTLAFAPPLVPVAPLASSMRTGTPMMTQPLNKIRGAIAAGGAAVSASLSHPAIANAVDSYYMSEAEEKQQILVLTIISVVVLTAPILGIQSARNAISAM